LSSNPVNRVLITGGTGLLGAAIQRAVPSRVLKKSFSEKKTLKNTQSFRWSVFKKGHFSTTC